MKIFEEFPEQDTCPICRTNKPGKCCLIGIAGTQEGHNIEAKVFHVDCLELLYYEENGIIAMKV